MGKDLTKWLKRLRKGDQSAFLPFYEGTAPGLLRFLLWKSRGDRATAEDVLQETFVRFLLSLDRLESEEPVAVQSYLLRIAKHCLIDKTARKAESVRPHIPIDEIADLTDPVAHSRQEKAVELRELAIAMGALNEREAEIIWLRDGLGFSHREVADQVGITEEASRQAYVRAKRNLLAELGGNFAPEKKGVPYYVDAELSQT